MKARSWFSRLAAGTELPPDVPRELDERGFVVLSGPWPSAEMERLVRAYDAAVLCASLQGALEGFSWRAPKGRKFD